MQSCSASHSVDHIPVYPFLLTAHSQAENLNFLFYTSLAMAELQVIARLAIIFTFIAFHAILTSEGRSMKSAWKDKFHSIDNENQMHEQASRFLTPGQSPRNDDCSDAGKKTVPSLAAHVQAANLGKPEAVYKDDFRPTNPGSSPGVGHSLVGLKKEAARPKSPSSNEEGLTVTETPGDFQSTRPGHSPGVGHVFQSTNEEPKA
ncbi:uncharacterized protein LOC115740314 [Rhodamnia argentea]|uniref:Uncharacterized protein LOC115740314 n=1 Tax=Rhodamnia argentea TaxID=178133 RepID=A0A8B8P4G9_9MYRT|nr:uncharacterized protein LOC115740314 [Rhodamnia argentea]